MRTALEWGGWRHAQYCLAGTWFGYDHSGHIVFRSVYIEKPDNKDRRYRAKKRALAELLEIIERSKLETADGLSARRN
jgi:hypothetical protein